MSAGYAGVTDALLVDSKLTREAYGSILTCLDAQIAFGSSVKSALVSTSRWDELPLYSTSVSAASVGGGECVFYLLSRHFYLPGRVFYRSFSSDHHG